MGEANKKAVRIEAEFDDGELIRATGENAATLWDSIQGAFAMEHIHGRPYQGPQLETVCEGGKVMNKTVEIFEVARDIVAGSGIRFQFSSKAWEAYKKAQELATVIDEHVLSDDEIKRIDRRWSGVRGYSVVTLFGSIPVEHCPDFPEGVIRLVDVQGKVLCVGNFEDK